MGRLPVEPEHGEMVGHFAANWDVRRCVVGTVLLRALHVEFVDQYVEKIGLVVHLPHSGHLLGLHLGARLQRG